MGCQLTTILLVSFRPDWLHPNSDENRHEGKPKLPDCLHGPIRNIPINHAGLEARKTPAVEEMFSLDFPVDRTFSQPRRRISGYISNVSTIIPRITF